MIDGVRDDRRVERGSDVGMGGRQEAGRDDQPARGVGCGRDRIQLGSGTLTYNKGKEYPIDVKGFPVGDVGATNEVSGKVFGLKKLADFGVAAGATVAGGGSVTAMRNQNGVSVELVATTGGLKFALGGGGIDMKIKQWPRG